MYKKGDLCVIKSKYEGCVNFRETGRDYDFIATIENNTDKTLKIFIDDLEGWYTEPIIVLAYDWVGFFSR